MPGLQVIEPSEHGGPTLLENSNVRQFIVRCEGYWKVRPAPDLRTAPVGCLPSGTVVYGNYIVPPVDDTDGPTGRAHLLPLKWIRLTAFEAPAGLKILTKRTMRDMEAFNSGLYCYMRNGCGAGLHETPQFSPCQVEEEEHESGGDAPPLTFKLLEGLETVKTVVSWLVGSTEDKTGKIHSQLAADELFAKKQRLLIRKAARRLGQVTSKLHEACQIMIEQRLPYSQGPLAALPPDVTRRLQRLRLKLALADGVAHAYSGGMQQGEEERITLGHLSQLERYFLELQRGGGMHLSRELRQEVLCFCKECSDLMEKVSARRYATEAFRPAPAADGSDCDEGRRSACTQGTCDLGWREETGGANLQTPILMCL